jgi:hypothetical protein
MLFLFFFILINLSHAKQGKNEFPADASDAQALIQEIENLKDYFSTTFKPALYVVPIQLNENSSLLKEYSFISLNKLKSISESAATTKDDKKILDEFFIRLAIEYRSGLLGLDDSERERLYEYPTEVRKNYEKYKKPRDLLDAWVSGNGRRYTIKINHYVDHREEYLRTTPTALTQADLKDIDKKLIARLYGDSASNTTNQHFDRNNLPEAPKSRHVDESSYYISEIYIASGNDPVKSIESPLYRRKSYSYNKYEHDLLKRILVRLKNSLEPNTNSSIKNTQLKIVDDFNYLKLISTPNNEIEVTTALVRAGFSACAASAYRLLNLYEINERTDPFFTDRNAHHQMHFDKMEDLDVKRDQNPNSLFKVMYIYNPERLKIEDRFRRGGYVRDRELEENLILYKRCVIDAFSFSIAHELAHIYLGKKSGENLQLNADEYLMDCHAFNHVQSTFGSVSGRDVFFRIYENLYKNRKFIYFTSSIGREDVIRRTNIIANLARNSRAICNTK